LSKLVVPGEIVAKGNFRSWANVLKKGEEYLSLFVGRAEIGGGRVRVIRLSGPYIPKVGDFVIGVVTDVQPLAATLDINSYVNGYIMANAFFKRRIDPSKFDLSKKVNVGDLVAAKVQRIERGKDVVLQPDQRWKVDGDAIFYISPAKAHYLYTSRSRIPSKIKELTGAELRLGANGIVVVKGDLKKIETVKRALDVIESKYNLNGLYNEIIKVLNKDGKSTDN
jgi:exosome complex component RRP4